MDKQSKDSPKKVFSQRNSIIHSYCNKIHSTKVLSS